jgi:hypothetical protein
VEETRDLFDGVIQALDWGYLRKPRTVADKIFDNEAEMQITRPIGTSLRR